MTEHPPQSTPGHDWRCNCGTCIVNRTPKDVFQSWIDLQHGPLSRRAIPDEWDRQNQGVPGMLAALKTGSVKEDGNGVEAE